MSAEIGLDTSRRGVDEALLDVLLSSWQSHVYALPIWPEKAFLSATVTAGSTGIPITATNLEYEADGLLVIGGDHRLLYLRRSHDPDLPIAERRASGIWRRI